MQHQMRSPASAHVLPAFDPSQLEFVRAQQIIIDALILISTDILININSKLIKDGHTKDCCICFTPGNLSGNLETQWTTGK